MKENLGDWWIQPETIMKKMIYKNDLNYIFSRKECKCKQDFKM